MRMVFGLVIAAFAAMSCTGCATLTTGTTQTVTVTTDPPGATCHLHREGTLIAVVNPTPGSIVIGKSSRDLSVRCSREGHDDNTAIVRPEFQAATLGNIILGGVVGIVIDAASGAAGAYPPRACYVLLGSRGLMEADA